MVAEYCREFSYENTNLILGTSTEDQTMVNCLITKRLSEQGTKQMATASARHILVETEEVCLDLKEQIEGGADFAQIAAEFSACPSGAQGGSLGEFSQGMMVPEFDAVVFSEEIGKVHGPVQTQFGYHLIEITSRED